MDINCFMLILLFTVFFLVSVSMYLILPLVSQNIIEEQKLFYCIEIKWQKEKGGPIMWMKSILCLLCLKTQAFTCIIIIICIIKPQWL